MAKNETKEVVTQQPKQTNVVKKQLRPIDKLKKVLNADSIQMQFQNALGKHSDIFTASVVDLFTSNKGLQACEPSLLVVEALKAATLNLPINPSLNYVYIVPFKNTPTFIMGYRGYVQLAMRSGEYRYINVDKVYEGEIQVINKLTGEIEISGKPKSDKVVGYFAYIELLNGFRKTLYMTVERVAKHAKLYAPTLKNNTKVKVEDLVKLAGTDPKGGIGWTSNFDEMAKKTVLRQILDKWGLKDIKLQKAWDYEQEAMEQEAKYAQSKDYKPEVLEEVEYIDVTTDDNTETGAEVNKEETAEVPY